MLMHFNRRPGPIDFDASDWVVVLFGAAMGAFVQLYIEKKFGTRK